MRIRPASVRARYASRHGSTTVRPSAVAALALSWLLVVATGVTAQVTFVALPDLDTGNVPLGLTTADFDGSGTPDVAVASAGSGVSIYLGDGSGGFVRTDVPTVGGQPDDVASADFNLDGIPDLAVAHFEFFGFVSIYLGDGVGGFAFHGQNPTGFQASSVMSSDFNEDGKPDLAVSNWSSANVSVLIGNGAGGFGPHATYPTGSNPSHVDAADFNGDGDLDLAVVNISSRTVSVLSGNGLGGFEPKTDLTVEPQTGPRGVTAVDLNNDGNPDIATANEGTNTVSVFLADGSGGFAPRADFPAGSGSRSVVAADFDHDGNPDLATANFWEGTVAVLLGDGAGAVAPPLAFAPSGNAHWVVTDDFNGDGAADVALTRPVCNGTGSCPFNKLSVLLNTSPPCPLEVRAGPDYLMTNPQQTWLDLDGAGGPLPAVHFRGVPIQGLGSTDTIVERLQTATPLAPLIPVELVSLQLESVNPIDVGGLPGVLGVTLQSDRGRNLTDPPDGPPSTGQLIIGFASDGLGGTFSSSFDVRYDLRLGGVNGPILRSGEEPISATAPWGREVPGQQRQLTELGQLVAHGVIGPSWSLGRPPCSTFVPGVPIP